MVNSRLRETERPRDVKSPENESSRAITNASKISRSGQTFPRPKFFEEHFLPLIIHVGFPGRGD